MFQERRGRVQALGCQGCERWPIPSACEGSGVHNGLTAQRNVKAVAQLRWLSGTTGMPGQTSTSAL
eukprot:11155282-Lingulodinium_polyedra.AAC.1